MIAKGGEYYEISPGGAMSHAQPGRPDVVICRRVADYPAQTPPAGAAIGECSKCGARVAFNPAGPHQDRPKGCMQCAGIEPLPIEKKDTNAGL